MTSIRSVLVAPQTLSCRAGPGIQAGASSGPPDWIAGQARSDRGRIEVLDADQACARAGLRTDAAPALAQALRRAGAPAVLVVADDQAPWLASTHASGSISAALSDRSAAHVDVSTFAGRWTHFLAQGFVPADAALLAVATDDGPLPAFTWNEVPPVPVDARIPVAGLYAIVDTVARLRQVLDAGITLVQLRIKQPRDADAAWFQALRSSLRVGLAASRGAGATLVVNDHWRVAAELGAPAVHLGQEDLGHMTGEAFLALAATGMALGVSSHAVWELCRARTLAPAYIACGPVWPTTTKDMPWRPQGLDNLAWWCRHAQRPVAAIGGILEASQVREAARAGADTVCIVRGLGDDPRHIVPALQGAFAQGQAERAAAAVPQWPHPSLEAAA